MTGFAKRLFFRPSFAGQFRRPSGIVGSLVGRLMGAANFFVYEGIERHADFRPGDRVLEIGFGPGVGLRYYLDTYDVHADGIDFSDLMVAKAARRNAAHVKSGRLRLTCADFLCCEAPERAYDRVVFANVTYFWDELDAPFSRLFRVLKEGGKLAFYMSDREVLDRNPVASGDAVFVKHGRASVREALVRCGFAEVETHEMFGGMTGFLVVCARRPV